MLLFSYAVNGGNVEGEHALECRRGEPGQAEREPRVERADRVDLHCKDASARFLATESRNKGLPCSHTSRRGPCQSTVVSAPSADARKARRRSAALASGWMHTSSPPSRVCVPRHSALDRQRRAVGSPAAAGVVSRGTGSRQRPAEVSEGAFGEEGAGVKHARGIEGGREGVRVGGQQAWVCARRRARRVSEEKS